MKNISVKGLKNFILTLKKEKQKGTLGTWWNEHTNKTFDSIRDFYKLGGKEVTLDTVRNLVDYILANMDEITEVELLAAANRAESKSVLLSTKRFYLYEQIKLVEPVVETNSEDTVVPTINVNEVVNVPVAEVIVQEKVEVQAAQTEVNEAKEASNVVEKAAPTKAPVKRGRKPSGK